jgi:hypothetical protein
MEKQMKHFIQQQTPIQTNLPFSKGRNPIGRGVKKTITKHKIP